MRSGVFVENVRSLDNILQWYQVQIEALQDFKIKIQLEIIEGRTSYVNIANLSLSEINQHFIDCIENLEHLTCFDLIANTEALFRIDFQERIKRKDKTEIGKQFRNVYLQTGNNISLENNIIAIWKQVVPAKKNTFSNFIGLLKYRHWLAHGRYWNPKLEQQYTVQSTCKILQSVIAVIQSDSI